MDDYSDEQDVKKDKKAEKAAPAPVATEGPHFYRNPDGGRLTTTKPPDTDTE